MIQILRVSFSLLIFIPCELQGPQDTFSDSLALLRLCVPIPSLFTTNFENASRTASISNLGFALHFGRRVAFMQRIFADFY